MKLHCTQLFTEGSVAKFSACRTQNPAVLGSSPTVATCWICSWLYTRPRLYIANWLPPTSWGL